MHSCRKSGDYDGWGLHVWGDSALTGTSWQEPLEAQMTVGEAGTLERDGVGVEFGVCWEVEVELPDEGDGGRWNVQVLPHKGDSKVTRCSLSFAQGLSLRKRRSSPKHGRDDDNYMFLLRATRSLSSVLQRGMRDALPDTLCTLFHLPFSLSRIAAGCCRKCSLSSLTFLQRLNQPVLVPRPLPSLRRCGWWRDGQTSSPPALTSLSCRRWAQSKHKSSTGQRKIALPHMGCTREAGRSCGKDK